MPSPQKVTDTLWVELLCSGFRKNKPSSSAEGLQAAVSSWCHLRPSPSYGHLTPCTHGKGVEEVEVQLRSDMGLVLLIPDVDLCSSTPPHSMEKGVDLHKPGLGFQILL